MSMLEYRAWQSEDLYELVPRLKPADVSGIQAAVGVDPRMAIEKSVTNSKRVWAIIIAGQVEGIIGIRPYPKAVGVGIPWLLSSPIIEKYPRLLLSEGRRWLKHFHRHYPTLTNIVDSRNVRARRWLNHIGFTVARVIPSYGIAKIPFTQLVSYKERNAFTRTSKKYGHVSKNVYNSG